MPFNLADFIEAFDTPDWLTHNSAWIYRYTRWCRCLRCCCAPRVFVELGTFRGDSFMSFCQAVAKMGTGTQCTAVDTWECGMRMPVFIRRRFIRSLRRITTRVMGIFRGCTRPLFRCRSEGYFPTDPLICCTSTAFTPTRRSSTTTIRGCQNSPAGAWCCSMIRIIRERGFGVWQLWDEISQGKTAFQRDLWLRPGHPSPWAAKSRRPFLEFLAQLNADHITHPAAIFRPRAIASKLMRDQHDAGVEDPRRPGNGQSMRAK